MSDWTVGHCANCDKELDTWATTALFCSERCKNYAKDVRFFRPRCRDGRALDPDVRETLDIRMQMLLWGGYSSKKRRVAPKTRSVVLAANGGLCCVCNQQPSTDVDHISGPSGERENLQGLCATCHNHKTRGPFQSPMGAEEEIADGAATLVMARPR